MATLREKLGHQMEERGQVDLLISRLQEQLQQSERSHNTTKKQVCVVRSKEVGYFVFAEKFYFEYSRFKFTDLYHLVVTCKLLVTQLVF